MEPMPVWDIHHADHLERCIGYALRDVKWETFHFDGVRSRGVYRLYLDFGKWLSIFDDAGAWFINEQSPEARQAVGAEDVRIDWCIHGVEEFDPLLNALLGKRLMGYGASPDREEFQLVFEGNAMIALSSGKLAEGDRADEGFAVAVRA